MNQGFFYFDMSFFQFGRIVPICPYFFLFARSMAKGIINRVNQDNKQKIEKTLADVSAEASPGLGPVVSAIAGLAAAWIASGSIGLLAHPLRRALTLTTLAVAILSIRSLQWRKFKNLLILSPAIVLAVYMISLPLPALNVMGVSLVLASLAISSAGQTRKMLLISSVAVTIFGLYRLIYTGIPLVWSVSDLIGRTLGRIGGFVSNQPVYIGATFAGLDFLILMSVLWILWLTFSPKPRKKRAIYGLLGILGGQVCYLIILSFVPEILTLIPESAEQTDWTWTAFFHKAIPWNLPVLVCGIQLIIAAAMFRWSNWYRDNTVSVSASRNTGMKQYVLLPAIFILAVLTPVVLVLFPANLSLQGKKIVFYEKGFLNWLKPEHGQYGRLSSGMYGMLPVYIENLGASTLVSPDLSEDDLRDADALVLLFPDEPWAEGQLERIWEFVHKGGTLLVMGEHTTRDSNDSNRFNEVLMPTNIHVEFDSATYAVGGWLQSYDAIMHPATTGVPDDRNQFGVVIGASLETGWPVRPILIGKWGWSDMGDRGSSRAMMGNGQYDSGEKLGDLVLAAEQPLGKGRVITFGDTSSLTNGINVNSYVFTSRLFGYIAGNVKNAHPLRRQILGIFVCLILAILLIISPGPWKVITVILCLSSFLCISNKISQKAGEIFPDGRYKTPNNLAYVDSSHLEAYSAESWRPDGVGGLILTLMRNGYLAHTLPEFTAERIMKADLLISIAPSKSFSKKERELVKDFVVNGGTFIIMTGLDTSGPSRSLLSLLGFAIGPRSPDSPEPEAMGHFKSPYLSYGQQQVFVRFHAAWPINCSDPNARVIANGQNDLPVIIVRPLGAGKVVVIGDTCFAMNKNLEWEGGETFEGMRENADFWRWFITQLRGEQMWIPPSLQTPQLSEPNATESEINNQEVAN
jgi:hypothetical protein